MPGHHFWTNFAAGELTERLDARVDLQKYRSGAHCLRNMVVLVHGGVATRAGTTFVAETKDSAWLQTTPEWVQPDPAWMQGGINGLAVTRLHPFQFNIEQAYMLEVGAFYIRVYANRTWIGTEIETPYSAEDVPALRYAQSADVLYIAHPRHAPRKLVRLSATIFELREILFDPPPTVEPVLTTTVQALSLSATSGATVAATSDNPMWYPGDVGRRIRPVTGRGLASITAWTNSQQVTVSIQEPFQTTQYPAGQWTMDGSANNATVQVIGQAGPQYSATFFGLTADCLRAEDVGKYLYVNGGIIRLETVTPNSGTGIIVKELSSTDPAPPGTWTIETPRWTAGNGYPGVVNLHDQRLRFAGSPSAPDRVWASRVGDYENFGRGVLDDDAYEFVIASDEVNLIRWMKGLRKALVGTVGGEYGATGPDDGTVTAAAPPLVEYISRWGADYNVDALRAWNVVMLLERGARKIRELAFDNLEENFQSPDLTILAEHLTAHDGIVDMAYLPKPDSMLLCVRSDGVLLGMTYERPEQVVAWHHHTTDGKFVAVATLPNMCGTGHEVWTVVERTLPAGTYRMIEVFDGGLSTDSALTYTGEPITVVGGVAHLEGKSVAVITRDRWYQSNPEWVDDQFMQQEDVTVRSMVPAAGQITLPVASANIEIGLPYAKELSLLRPELTADKGSMQGLRQHYSSCVVRFYCTQGTPTINGEAIVYPPDAARPFTGDIPMANLRGWHRGENRLVIRQTDPLPMTVLGVGVAVQIEDG